MSARFLVWDPDRQTPCDGVEVTARRADHAAMQVAQDIFHESEGGQWPDRLAVKLAGTPTTIFDVEMAGADLEVHVYLPGEAR